MNIGNIQFKNITDKSVISADITINNRVENLYFSVDSRYSNFVFPDASPFVATLLLSSMKTGNPIYSESTISKRLYHTLPKIYEIFRNWKTDFSITSVIVDNKPDQPKNNSNIGCFFSGGVDSFYTFLKNKNSLDGNIKYLIFVHGFDIDLDDKELFKKTYTNLSSIASREGVELIVVETNLRQITDRYAPWGWSHGSALAAVSLFLRNGFNKIYIPSSNSWDEIFPWGSHPDLDPLWSTEILDINHDGNESDRLQKVKYISTNGSVWNYLRVCYNNFAGSYNCGKCEKCIRTMLQFKVWDALEKVVTFDQALDLNLIEKLENNDTTQRHFGKCLKELKRQGRFENVQNSITNMLSNNRKLTPKEKIIKILLGLEKKYLGGFLVFKLYKLKKRLSRNSYFKPILGRLS